MNKEQINWLLDNMIYYLDNHTHVELFDLVDEAIERRKELSPKEHPIYPFIVKDSKISKMESNCGVLYNLISKNDLNHKERMTLLFIYGKFGDKGVERLKQILSYQTNYNKAKTETQIENYMKKGKFYGISCKKIQEWIGSTYCKGCKYAKST